MKRKGLMKMKKVVFGEFGGPEVLKVVEVDPPKPDENEVLIAVRSMAVNNHDILRRQGRHESLMNKCLGYDCCGVIVALGDKVTKFKIDDHVCAFLEKDGYAEYAVAHYKMVVRAPSFTMWHHCAALPYAGTALMMSLFKSNCITAGQKILIHGGAGGLGSLAVQICKSLGLTVYVSVESKEHVQFCHLLKDDVCINDKLEKYWGRVLEETNELGVNYILDCSDRDNEDDIRRDIECLAKRGRLILMGSQMRNMKLDKLATQRVVDKGIQIQGSYFQISSYDTIEELLGLLEEHIWPKIEASEIIPEIFQTFDLEEVVAAHTLMERKIHTGRIVLTTKRFGPYDERTKL